MTSGFYLFLPLENNLELKLNSLELSWVYENNNNLSLAKGVLSEFIRVSSGKKITVVLPGEDVLFSQVNIPGKNIKRILQAVPYVLEDDVVDDVDNLYFAIRKSNSEPLDTQYDVAIINKNYFENVVKQLEEAGVQADVITADYLLFDNTLLFDEQRVVFNSSKLKFSSSISIAIAIATNTLADADDIRIINCRNTRNELENLILENNLDQVSCNEPVQLCLINNCSSANIINLLQGKHKKKKDWSQTGKKWLPVAVLFFIWLSIEGVLFVSDYLSLIKQNKALSSEIVFIYKKTFPKSRRIIDAKAQMQQKLASLKKRKGQSGRSFTEMLSNSARAFSAVKGLTIKSLRYYDGRLNLEIQIASLQALDKMKEQLSNDNGYQVEILNASSGKENVTARIQITGAKL